MPDITNVVVYVSLPYNILFSFCQMNRFDGKAIVERLKGKRLLFVGDSVNRNQWDSMMCMLHSSIPGKKKLNMGGLNHTLYSFRSIVSHKFSLPYYATKDLP